jgi:hypothetical protein
MSFNGSPLTITQNPFREKLLEQLIEVVADVISEENDPQKRVKHLDDHIKARLSFAQVRYMDPFKPGRKDYMAACAAVLAGTGAVFEPEPEPEPPPSAPLQALETASIVEVRSPEGAEAATEPTAAPASQAIQPTKPKSEPKYERYAKQFLELFGGLKDWHGTYAPGETRNDKGKLKNKTWTVNEPVTVDLWALHLQGKKPLGIAPIERETNTVKFGAIDIDQYEGLDHKKLVWQVRAEGLPLNVFPSKSGGAHLYLFVKEPFPAARMRTILAGYLQKLSLPPDTEVFPKQDQLTGPDEVGNWINVPYFSATTRRLITEDGEVPLVGFFEKVKIVDPVTLPAADAAPEVKIQPNRPSKAGFPLDQWMNAYRGYLDGLGVGTEMYWPKGGKNGRKWPTRICPFRHHESDGFAILQDSQGRVFATCQETKCLGFNWLNFRKKAEGIDSKAGTSEDPWVEKPESSRNKASEIASELCNDLELFSDPQGDAYATVPVKGHYETLEINTKTFQVWLSSYVFKTKNSKTLSGSEVADICRALTGQARHGDNATQREVYLRVAVADCVVFVDQGDSLWQRIVKVTPDGSYSIVQYDKSLPVRFRRTQGMQELPAPVESSTLDPLWDFANVAEKHRPLVVAWLLFGLVPWQTMHPILGINGYHGTGKSFAARVLKALIDPSAVELQDLPEDLRDLTVSLLSSWVPVYNNLSYLNTKQGNFLCGAVEGKAVSTRELYTNKDQSVSRFVRPIISTSIAGVGSNGDILDRTLTIDTVTLANQAPRRDEKQRIDDLELWAQFERARPGLLGALYRALACGLRDYEATQLGSTVRFQPCVRLAVAAFPALGIAPESLVTAIAENTAVADRKVTEASPLVSVLAEWIEGQRDIMAIEGTEITLTDLRSRLSEKAPDDVRRSKSFPNNEKALRGFLMKSKAALDTAGVRFDFISSHPRTRKSRTRVWCEDESGFTVVHGSQADGMTLLNATLKRCSIEQYYDAAANGSWFASLRFTSPWRVIEEPGVDMQAVAVQEAPASTDDIL